MVVRFPAGPRVSLKVTRRKAKGADQKKLGFATVGSFPHCKWDCKWHWWMSCRRIPLLFATLESFPHCKWDCKWCWWRSYRWSFGGSLARNAFLRDCRCTKPCVFPQSVSPNLDDLPLQGVLVAQLVWRHPCIADRLLVVVRFPWSASKPQVVTCRKAKSANKKKSMIYICCATGARRSRVWSDHGRIMLGSFSDRFRIVNGVSTVFRAWSTEFHCDLEL